ncbi:MAG: hypothetical protein RLZZ132_58 [Bacteroidota bacterium]|jgi:hypothetical protein|uniref:SbsA Ig-like domain-containing protein n=1 Tax=Aquirufa novilacunae TaxID=3139305 RepID=A0ABW8SVA4_9BACT
MKKIVLFLSVCFAVLIHSNANAQYATIQLTNEADTIRLGDNPKTAVSRLLTFTYDAKMEAAFAQVSMDAHHLNPFDLPEVIVNGKTVQANIYFPVVNQSAKFYFFKVRGLSDLVVNSPVGQNSAKLSFLLSPAQLMPGKNYIRITIGNRNIENLDDFALTNPKLELRTKANSDSYTDFTK